MSLVLVYVENGQPVEERERRKIESWIAQSTAPFWLDLISPTEDELSWLEAAFRFHPLTIEDLRGVNPRPKLEDYPGYVFLVSQSADIALGELGLIEVHTYVSERFIITSHSGELENHEAFRHTFADKSSWLKRGTDFCLYRILDNLTDGYLEVVDDIDDELDRLQSEILTARGMRSVDPIVTIRRQLATLRRISSPMREMASELAIHDFPFVHPENRAYFRDVHNLLVTIFDMIETQRDIASNILDAHLSAISNRLNEIMKRLTIVATIFLPLSFVASLGGMNFIAIPFGDPLFFAATIAILILITLFMLVWFRRQGWF